MAALTFQLNRSALQKFPHPPHQGMEIHKKIKKMIIALKK